MEEINLMRAVSCRVSPNKQITWYKSSTVRTVRAKEGPSKYIYGRDWNCWKPVFHLSLLSHKINMSNSNIIVKFDSDLNGKLLSSFCNSHVNHVVKVCTCVSFYLIWPKDQIRVVFLKLFNAFQNQGKDKRFHLDF